MGYFNILSGKKSTGTKAPQTSATTLTIPFIAPLFDTKFHMRNAIIVAQIVNKNDLIIYIIPVLVIIIFHNITKLIPT